MKHQSTLLTHTTLGLLIFISPFTSAWADETISRPLATNVDIALVIDDTKNMADALPGLAKAVRNFINHLPDTSTPPQIALITFNNQVDSRLVTSDLNELLKVVENLTTSQGHQCAKAAVEALTIAAQNLKQGGTLLLATQSVPQVQDDLNGLKQLLTDKNIRMNVLISGSCQ
jgi:hypothetical protein